MEYTHIRISKDHKEKLKTEATRNGVSMLTLLHELIDVNIKKKETVSREEKIKPTMGDLKLLEKTYPGQPRKWIECIQAYL